MKFTLTRKNKKQEDSRLFYCVKCDELRTIHPSACEMDMHPMVQVTIETAEKWGIPFRNHPTADMSFIPSM